MAMHGALRLLFLPAIVCAAAGQARAQCTDAYEPNETCAEAALLDPDASPDLELAFPQHPNGPDVDSFHTFVPAGETFEVLLDAFAPPVFLLEVFDAPDCSQAIGTAGLFDPPLRFVNGGASPLELWLRVSPDPDGNENPCESYGLIMRSFDDVCSSLVPDAFEPNDDFPSASLLSPGSYPDLNVQGQSADYYLIPAPNGWRVELTMAQDLDEYPGAHPTVQFFDASTGQVIQGAFADGVTNYVNLTGNAEVGLVVRRDTALTCSQYDMTVAVFDTPCSALTSDVFEENDTCANGAFISPGNYSGLGATTNDHDFYRVDLAPGDIMVTTIEYDPALASSVRSQVYGTCSPNDWYAVASSPGRLTTVVQDGSGPSFYTLTAAINLQEFDPEAPCAEYDLTLRTYSEAIGTPYCPAVPNSSGSPAVLAAYGSTAVADEELALLATELPPFAPGIFFFGPNQVQLPLGNGVRCVGGAINRLRPVMFAGLRAYIFHVINFDSSSAQLLTAGSTWRFQAWFRDDSSTNLSNAVTVTFP